MGEQFLRSHVLVRSETENSFKKSKFLENAWYQARLKGKKCSPMTMETRCSKVIFLNYSKKKQAENTLVPPLRGTREKNVCFSRIICSRYCTRRNLRFHVEIFQRAGQKQLKRR